MSSDVVYPVIKSMPEKEQIKLFERLRMDIEKSTSKKGQLLSDDDAKKFLLKNIFKLKTPKLR